MDCPVCKCPNPPGATHCGMCYEIFNRSAAQAYLHAVKRERRESGEDPPEGEAEIKSQRVIDQRPSLLSQIDWIKVRTFAVDLGRKFWKPAAGVVLAIGLWFLLSVLLSVGFWYGVAGKKFTYAFSDKKPLQYLVGMKQNIKVWSERQGRLDTPIQKRFTDEMGNLLFEKARGKGDRSVQVTAREWIQIFKEEGGSSSRTIPLDHPSLAAAKLVLDKRGAIAERRFSPSPRLAKAIPFIALRFPKGSLKDGRTWTEPIEWLDDYDGWKIKWNGTMRWTLGELIPCRKGNCAQIQSSADFTPKLVDVPAWARGAMGELDGKASGQGTVQFDAGNRKLVGHEFAYQGLLRIPIQNVDRIPIDLRVGRHVRGPGVIVIYLENKIDIRIN